MLKKKTGNRVKTLCQKEALSRATNFVAYGLSINKFTMLQEEERAGLYNDIQTDVFQSMETENLAYGNYQIPTGQTGNILEIPLSVNMDPLSLQELADLGAVPKSEMDILFEEAEEITEVSDVNRLLQFILASTNPASFLKVSKGIISLINVERAPGIVKENKRVPVTGFFAKLDTALSNLKGNPSATQTLINWVKGRLKAFFRVGNRPATSL